MAEQTQELVTVKQLADRAGVKPTAIRRILRKQFPREDKGKSYEWQPDDPQIELILKAVKSHKAEKPKAEKPKAQAEKPRADKPRAKTVKPKTTKQEDQAQGEVKFGEIDPTTGGVPIDLNRIGTIGAVKQDKTRQC